MSQTLHGICLYFKSLLFFWNSNLTALLYFYLLNLAIIDHENDHKLGHIHWKINWKKKR